MQILKTVNIYDLTMFLRVKGQLCCMAAAQPFLRLPKTWPRLGWGWCAHSPPGQIMLLWPEVTVHHGVSPPTMRQLKCPFNTAARAPQQVVQESHKEVLAPPKPPVSLRRLPHSDWEG